MLKRVVYNSGVQLLAKGISLTLGLVSTAILTRKLGAELYGNYVFLLAASLFLTSIADWGTQIIGVRELSRSQDKGRLFASLLGLRLLIATLVLLAALPFVLLMPAFNAFLLASLLALVLVFLAVVDTSLEVVFQTFLRMDLKVFAEVVGNLSFLLLLLVLLGRSVGLEWVFGAWVVSKLIGLSLLLPFTKKLTVIRVGFDRQLFVRIVRESLPMGMLLILFSAYDRAVDTFMIKYFLGSTQVAFYGLSYKIYGHLVLPAYFLVNSLFPFLSKGKKGVGRIGLGLMGLGLVLLLPMVMILAPVIIRLLAGNSFLISVSVLRILALGLIFSWLNHLTGFSLVAQNRQSVSLKIGALAMAFNLLSNWMLIPRFGILAAAWVTVATEGLVFCLSLLALTVFGSRNWYNSRT